MSEPREKLRKDAEEIWTTSLGQVMPEPAVRRALAGRRFPGRVVLAAVGKAAWRMADEAKRCLGSQITEGIVLTKDGHVQGPIAGLQCLEASHPVPDERSVAGAEAILALTERLRASDTVLFLVSGGGSALFEDPLVPLSELQALTGELLASGADIREINTIRKRLSRVKGGRFARHCEPAQVFQIVLSDIIGSPLDQIASGPAAADQTTAAEALGIIEKYRIRLSGPAREIMRRETIKKLGNVQTVVTGSVSELCRAAASAAAGLGYQAVILDDRLAGEAAKAGRALGMIARCHSAEGRDQAFILGGETTVIVRGRGLGGRNQELALAAAPEIAGLPNAAVFALGSDGTDGPTDAAGGYVDGNTEARLRQHGLSAAAALADNDSYHALAKCGGLIRTGPTGTNVLDLAVALVKGEK